MAEMVWHWDPNWGADALVSGTVRERERG